MNAYEIEKDEEEFEEYLNSAYGDVEVCGMMYPAGKGLKELDEVAFRCALSDEPIRYGCGECGAEYDDEDEAEECCKDEFKEEDLLRSEEAKQGLV